MTAEAPAAMKPAAKLSTRCLAWSSVPSDTPGSAVAARVAEVMEQDDGVLREVDRRGDPALPEVLMRVVVRRRRSG